MDNRIADFRRMRGMSLDDLSESSGLSKSSLSELERGITKPMLDSARRIAQALDAYEHEVWPEGYTMPPTVRTTDTALAAAEARIAELGKQCAGHLQAFSMATENQQWQRDRIAALEKALEPFSELGESYDESFADDDEATFADDELTVGDLRRAAALLKEKE